MIKKIKISVCFLLLFSAVHSQEITTILKSEYEASMISSGKNYPTVSLGKNNLDDISVLLHHRVPVEDIKKHYNWSDSIFQTKLEMLLKAERTSRNNMNYYFSFQEKRNNDKREAFNIYGNTSRMYGSILSIFIGKAMNFGIYGNERDGENFNTLTKKQLQEWFGMKETEDIKSFKKGLLRELIKLSNNPDYKISDIYKSGFSKIDMMKGNILTIPVFNLKDNKKLNKIANLITNDLIVLFEKNRNTFEKNYQNSSYCNEITFEEYFIWWYHIFYTEVTENLILKDHIKRPATGVFPYILKI